MNDSLNTQEPIFKEVVAKYEKVLGYPIDEIVADTEPKNGWY